MKFECACRCGSGGIVCVGIVKLNRWVDTTILSIAKRGNLNRKESCRIEAGIFENGLRGHDGGIVATRETFEIVDNTADRNIGTATALAVV